MAETNIRLLASKIEALDPQAQHAVEIAVDSLLDDAGFVPNPRVDARIVTLERRIDARGDQTRDDEVDFLDEHDGDNSVLKSAIESLINTARQTLDELVRDGVATPGDATPGDAT